MPPVVVSDFVQRRRINRPPLPHGVGLYGGEMYLVLTSYFHTQITHDRVINFAHRRLVLKRLRRTLPRGIVVVENHDVVVNVPALSISMGGDKVRAIRSHFLRQFHAGTVNPSYVRLTITAELFWRKALRNQKGLIFALCSCPMNPVESLRAPGLGSRCRIQ